MTELSQSQRRKQGYSIQDAALGEQIMRTLCGPCKGTKWGYYHDAELPALRSLADRGLIEWESVVMHDSRPQAYRARVKR